MTTKHPFKRSSDQEELSYLVRVAFYCEKNNNLSRLAETKAKIVELRQKIEEGKKWFG